jgi:hypothetical protein
MIPSPSSAPDVFARRDRKMAASPAVSVDKATNELLLGPDWTLNIAICDAVNSDHGSVSFHSLSLSLCFELWVPSLCHGNNSQNTGGVLGTPNEPKGKVSAFD